MINAMRDAGLDPGSIIQDGKLHRFDVPGDRSKSKNGWYVFYDGDIQAGRFGSWKTGENITWCSRQQSELSPEEKAAYKAKMEAARRQRAEEQQRVAEECRAWCKETWEKSGPATDDHPYLAKKQVKAFGLKLFHDALIIPVRSLDSTIHGFQFIQPDGTKKFKTGTVKQGHFHLIGKPVDATMIICEGYATGASIHMATGHAVLVAFDAGNLKAVAELVHKQRPQLKLIIAADNDQWTKNNPGMTKAKDAAQAVKAELRSPKFSNLETKPTDFNDLHCLQGLETVRRQIFPAPMAEYAPPPMDDDYTPPEVNPDEYSEHPLNTAPFQLLGYDHGEYFYLANGNGQVKALTADKHTVSHLLTLAPLQWWEREFPAKNGFGETAAKNLLIQTNHGQGIYDSSRVRGLGAWEDNGRSVLHLGDVLVVNGVRMPLAKFKTRYIYERAISISDEETRPLQAAEAGKLIQLCNMLSWQKPINGRLLAGWCIAAVVCGALKWRPHMWLTGPSGSGKTWIIHSIIKHIAGRHLKGMLGSTTEAGLRNVLRNDAFSVFFDEFEAEDRNAAARIQAILEFARPASSNEDSKIYKAKSGGGGVNAYQPRSCIGVASVNVNMSQKADTSRITVLELGTGTKEHFDNVITPFWRDNIQPAEFARGVRARAISLIPIIIQNAEVFQQAVTAMLGSRRSGDQYGSLLACAYSLCSSKVISTEEARSWVDAQDWEGHATTEDQSDEYQCLSAILEGIVKCDNTERSISELINDVELNPYNKTAWETLARHGIRHERGWFLVANRHSCLGKILEKTPWGSNWARIIARLPEAEKTGNVKFSGSQARAVKLPVSYVL